MKKTSRFGHLLDRYLNNIASQEECDELMRMVHDGSHDASLKSRIDEILTNESGQENINMIKSKDALKRITSSEEALHSPFSMKTWRWMAAAAMVVISLSAGWWLYGDSNSINEIQSITQEDEHNSSSVFKGKQFIRLPDGSTVILNEDSELSYSESFGREAREVMLKGEAYFDVQHDTSRPFKVLTGTITTTVLGTAFNVQAFDGQPEIKVTVTRGKVQVADREHTLGVIVPDQQIAVNTHTSEFAQTDIKAEIVSEWRSQYMILDNVSMETAAAIIEEKYNVKIIFNNEGIKACRITATFLNGESLDQVLAVVSGVVQATYSRQPDGNVQMNGKGCE